MPANNIIRSWRNLTNHGGLKFAFSKALVTTTWARQFVARSLKGAYRLQMQPHHVRTMPMTLDQALQAWFLPAILMTLALSGATYMLSCSIIQVAWGSRSQPPHNECPQRIIPNTWELLAAVHAAYVALWHGTRCSPMHEAAQALARTREAQASFMASTHRAKKQRGTTSSSSEYVNVLLEPDSDEEIHRAHAAGPSDDMDTAETRADLADQEARVPLWDSGQISQRVSQAVGEALGLNGYVLAHVPGRWRELRGVVATLHEMRPHEQLHPCTIPCGDETLRSLEERATMEREAHQQAADHEGLVDGPLFGIHANPSSSRPTCWTQIFATDPRASQGHDVSHGRILKNLLESQQQVSSSIVWCSLNICSHSPPVCPPHPKHPWCPGEAEKSDLPCEGRGQDSFDRPLFRTEAGEASPPKGQFPIAPPAEAGIPLEALPSALHAELTKSPKRFMPVTYATPSSLQPRL